MNDFRRHIIALLILLFCVGSVFVGIRSALTPGDAQHTAAPVEWAEYQGSDYSTVVYHSAPMSGTSVVVPMRSTSSSLFRHSQSSYSVSGSSATPMSGTYTAQRLAQTSHSSSGSYGAGNAASGGYRMGWHTYQGASAVASTYSTPVMMSVSYSNHTPAFSAVSAPVVSPTEYVQQYAHHMSAPGRRKLKTYDDGTESGEYDGEANSGNTKIWNEEDQAWEDAPAIGTEREVNGVWCVWTTDGWKPKYDQKDPDAPIGDIPWVFMLLLVAGYVGVVACRKRKRQTLSVLLLAMTALPLSAATGDSCSDPIRLGKDYKTRITQTGTVWYVANTIDLPLSVSFTTDTPDQPEVEMDFTCEQGVYADSILCSLFCPKGGSGGVNIEMPHRPKLGHTVLEGGQHCYSISMGKTYRDMLFQAGLDHDVDVYIKVTYHSTGDMSIAPDGTFANCMDGSKFMHLGDTVLVYSGDLARHVIIPYVQWQNDSIRYIWHGDQPLTLATATVCDFDPRDNTNGNIVDFFPDLQPDDTVKVTSAEMQHYVSGGEFANEAGMFFAKWYTQGSGVLTVERVPIVPPAGGAVLMQYDQATPITPSDTSAALYAIPRAMNTATQFISHTDHVIKMWVGKSPAFSATDAIAAYTFAPVYDGQVLNLDSAMLHGLWQQTADNYLYLKIWCTARTSVTPVRWAASECASHQSLFTGQKHISRSSTEVFKMLYSEWRGGDITIKSDKTAKYNVYVADTCQVYISPTNPHTVFANATLTRTKPLTITAEMVASWADRVDADGYLYWRFFNSSSIANITITRHAPEPADPTPDLHPSADIAVRCIGAPDDAGTQQVEIRANRELHLKLVDALGLRINEWDAWKNAEPMVLSLKPGNYQLLADNADTIRISIP